MIITIGREFGSGGRELGRKNRSRYYELYTGKTWGDKLLYDLCINTTRIPIEDAAAMTAKIVKK